MNHKTRNRLLLVSPLVLISGVLVIRILLGHGHYTSGVARQKRLNAPLTAAQLAPWQGGHFVEVNSAETVEALKKATETNPELSRAQRDELQDSVRRFFQAYSDGRFNSYFEFKTHGADYSLDYTGETERMLSSLVLTKTNLPPFPEEPKAKLETIWGIVTGASPGAVGPTLTQVDSQSVRISVTTATQADPTQWIHVRAAESDTPDPRRQSPNFASYSIIKNAEAPETVRKREERVLMAMLEANARYSTSDVASPLYVVFYWSSRTSHWYPWVFGKYPLANFDVLF